MVQIYTLCRRLGRCKAQTCSSRSSHVIDSPPKPGMSLPGDRVPGLAAGATYAAVFAGYGLHGPYFPV